MNMRSSGQPLALSEEPSQPLMKYFVTSNSNENKIDRQSLRHSESNFQLLNALIEHDDARDEDIGQDLGVQHELDPRLKVSRSH
jgi:hypothetical protein